MLKYLLILCTCVSMHAYGTGTPDFTESLLTKQENSNSVFEDVKGDALNLAIKKIDPKNKRRQHHEKSSCSSSSGGWFSSSREGCNNFDSDCSSSRNGDCESSSSDCSESSSSDCSSSGRSSDCCESSSSCHKDRHKKECEKECEKDNGCCKRGPRGPRGVQGFAGPAGENGLNGQNGRNGADGIAGPQGPTGPTGVIGAFAQASFQQTLVAGVMVPPPQLVFVTGPVVFNAVGANSPAIFDGASTFTLPNSSPVNASHYLVNYGFALNSETISFSGGAFELTLDGVSVPSSQLTTYTGDEVVSTSAIVTTIAGNSNTLQLVSLGPTTVEVGTTVNVNPSFTGAYISVVQLN